MYAAIYFLIQMSVYGVVFYLPTEVAAILGKRMGFEVGVVSALPWACAAGPSVWTTLVGRPLEAAPHLAEQCLPLRCCQRRVPCAEWRARIDGPLRGGFRLHCRSAGVLDLPTGYLSRDEPPLGASQWSTRVELLGGFVAPNIKVWAENSILDFPPRALSAGRIHPVSRGHRRLASGEPGRLSAGHTSPRLARASREG